jgi:hypothetical protein
VHARNVERGEVRERDGREDTVRDGVNNPCFNARARKTDLRMVAAPRKTTPGMHQRRDMLATRLGGVGTDEVREASQERAKARQTDVRSRTTFQRACHAVITSGVTAFCSGKPTSFRAKTCA